MKAAEARAEIRAHNIVQAPVHDARLFTPVQTTQAAMPIVRAQPIARQSREQHYEDVAGDLVDLKLAQSSYRAMASIVRTDAEMSRTLLDTLT